jgi:hypothetical protein
MKSLIMISYETKIFFLLDIGNRELSKLYCGLRLGSIRNNTWERIFDSGLKSCFIWLPTFVKKLKLSQNKDGNLQTTGTFEFNTRKMPQNKPDTQLELNKNSFVLVFNYFVCICSLFRHLDSARRNKNS